MSKSYSSSTHRDYATILALLIPDVLSMIRAKEGGLLRRYSQEEMHRELQKSASKLPQYGTLNNTQLHQLHALLANSNPKPYYTAAATNHSGSINSSGSGKPPGSGYCRFSDVSLLNEILHARQTCLKDQSLLYRTIGLWFTEQVGFTAYDTSAAINHGVGTNPDVSAIWQSAATSPLTVAVHCTDAVQSQDMVMKGYGAVLNYKSFSHYQYMAVPMRYRKPVSPTQFPLAFHAIDRDLKRRCDSDGIGLLVVFIDDSEFADVEKGKDPSVCLGTCVHVVNLPRCTHLSPYQVMTSLDTYRLPPKQIC